MKYFVWIVLIFLIFVRYFTSRPVYKDGDRIRISTTVLTDPANFTSSMGVSQYLKIDGLKVYSPEFPEIYYGDSIVVEGVISGDKLLNPQLISVAGQSSFLWGFRNSIISFYQNSLPQPESGVIGGIVMGARGLIPDDFYTDVKNSGVSYMVSASGIKLAILISVMTGLVTLIFPRRKAIVFVILSCILYILITGFGFSIIRSGIMACFVFLGQITGRIINRWRILFFTAAIILLVQPSALTDISFILSFVAIASIMLFENPIKKLLKFLPEFLRNAFSVSFCRTDWYDSDTLCYIWTA